VRKRFVVVSVAVPVAVGAIIAAYSLRHHSSPQRTPVASNASSSIGYRPGGRSERDDSTRHLLSAGDHIQTEAQASSRAVEVAQAFGAAHPRVVAVEMLPLGDAITRTQRAFEDDLDLGAAGYGESTRTLPAWRVQLDDTVFGTGMASAAILPTAILVLAAGGMLIDMTLGYPVPQ
jgi:hypothetical protein